jgi:hypothetical protein
VSPTVSHEPYPDREDWPAYWRVMRTAAVWLLVIAVIVGGSAYLPRPDGLLPRIAVEVLIAVLVVMVGRFLASRVNAWWESHQP